jgi:VanZ family protein
MPVIVWMALIFLGSTDVLSAAHTSRFLVPFLRWLDPEISLAALAQIQLAIRKLGHLSEYAILAMLLWRALRLATERRSKMSIFGMALVCSAAFAASDEFHQSFVGSRTSSTHDVLIDICGALIALLFCAVLTSRERPARI